MNLNDDSILDEALQDPQNIFGSPGEVVQATVLSVATRRRILERWKEECLAVQNAGGAQHGGEDRRLAEIDAALEAVSELSTARTSDLS